MKTIQVDLFDLINRVEIEHPTELTGIDITLPSTVRLEVTGSPWWKGSKSNSPETVAILLEEIHESRIIMEDLVNDQCEFMEGFEIQETRSIAWAGPKTKSIYGASAIEDPFSLIEKVDVYLREYASVFEASSFFNFGLTGTYTEFKEITRGNSYLLGIFPEALGHFVESCLVQNGVSYSMIERLENQVTPRYFLRFYESYFFCDSAFALYEIP